MSVGSGVTVGVSVGKSVGVSVGTGVDVGKGVGVGVGTLRFNCIFLSADPPVSLCMVRRRLILPLGTPDKFQIKTLVGDGMGMVIPPINFLQFPGSDAGLHSNRQERNPAEAFATMLMSRDASVMFCPS